MLSWQALAWKLLPEERLGSGGARPSCGHAALQCTQHAPPQSRQPDAPPLSTRTSSLIMWTALYCLQVTWHHHVLAPGEAERTNTHLYCLHPHVLPAPTRTACR